MPFDAKELMIDITKVGNAQIHCGGTYCYNPSFCQCTYLITHHCGYISYVPCKFGTYTCIASIVTCGGTIYCAGSNDPTILFQQIDKETIAMAKAQLAVAMKEIEAQEKRLAAGHK